MNRVLSGRSYRRAFTLVELLVVIAIIGVLIALLLPAIQAARAAARATVCSNNLRQLGIAMHVYHEAMEYFPAGGVSVDWWDGPHLSNWAIELLPYIEESYLLDLYVKDQDIESAANTEFRESIVPTFNCPTDRNAIEIRVPDSGPASVNQIRYRHASYRAMAGRSDGQEDFWTECHGAGCYLWQADWAGMGWRGVFHYTGHGKLKNPESSGKISDGLSQTIALGEMVSRSHPGRGTFWANTYTSYNKSAASPSSATLLGDYFPCREYLHSEPCKRAWGSYHPAGIHFAMCDGSVHTISTRVDMEVFCRMGSVAEGLTVSVP